MLYPPFEADRCAVSRQRTLSVLLARQGGWLRPRTDRLTDRFFTCGLRLSIRGLPNPAAIKIARGRTSCFLRVICLPTGTALSYSLKAENSRAQARARDENYSFALLACLISQYSILSATASQLASMMLVELPTVRQFSLPSLDSMSTRTRDAVPEVSSRIRTL